MGGRRKIGLKPCPFCGRRIEIWDNLENGRMIYYVRCSCGAAFYNKFRSPEQAAEKWNRRATDGGI